MHQLSHEPLRASIEALESRQLLSVSISSATHPTSSGPASVVPFPPISADTGSVTGTVDDSGGAGIAGATVYLIASGPIPYGVSPIANPASAAIGIWPRQFPLVATTNQNGNFSLATVPVGSYTATASDQGFGNATSASLTVAKGTTTAIPTITLTATAAAVYGTVTGTVTDSTGAALANALVELSPASLSISGIQSSKALNLFVPIPIPGPPGQFRFTRTDSSGNYTFNTVRTGDYVVTASDHGYQRNSSASLTVAQGTNTAPTIALTANPTPVFGTVTGTVTDASGNPLAGATVLISPIARAIPLSASSNTSTGVVVFPPSSVQFATTDQNGQYSFSQVRSGTYTVTAFDKGFLKNTSASFTIVQGSNTVPPLALTARPTPVFGSVTGVVTDSNGAVLANALVEISPARSSTLASTNSFAGAGMVLPPIFPPGPIQVVRTDANGQYTFGKVRTGSYLVTASDRGYQKASSDAFTVAAGSNSAPTMKLSAQPTPTYGSVTGMVTDTGGTAIANALIEMYPALTTTPVAGANNPITAPIGIFPRRKFYIARTDQNGQYMLSDVRTGSYVVTAFAHGYQRQTSAAFTVALGSNTAPTLALATTTTPTQPL